MRIAYPKSFLKLLLIGFALTMLPLLFAFGNAALYLDRLAEQSRKTVTQAVQATQASRGLVEQLTLMERSARQYFVLHDNLLLDNYSHSHKKFTRTVTELAGLSLDKGQRHELELLSARETALYKNIFIITPDNANPQSVISEFVELSDQAQNILAENNRLIDHESSVLAESAERTQRMLLWQTLTLVPVALLIALVITFLVAQPIRRMDAAIRRLGEGQYGEAISIDGPGDLRTLGERLDWLRSQLQQLEQQKQRFLRHVSHELKTPLTAIREGSELLHDEVGGPLTPQQKEIAGILRESSLRLQKMIENLLNYSAVQFQKPELKTENIVLENLLEQVLANYALTLSGKQIEIQRDLQPLEMRGDLEKLHTVLDNLLSNAIKFTPQSGHIRISIRQQGPSVLLEVHDSGPGIAIDDHAKLFDPFYRGDGPYESLVSGSGLGLSIAQEYIEAHGGKIALQTSERGAHFSITLPLEPLPV